MVRQGERTTNEQASDLLNFHFSSTPRDSSSRTTASSSNRRSSRAGSNARHSQQYRRTKEDRASARRKACSQNFYLHSSAEHAFVITRRPLKQQQQYSYNGPDSPVAWESVRIVKYLSTAQQQERCPICLDSFTCPRITKCGHVFCFGCVIRHVQAYCANHPYADGPKCPCCAIPLHLEDLRPVQLITTVHAQVNQHVKLVKLHRVKNCPCPFLPLEQAHRRSSPHAAPCQTDADAAYSKFNYVDPELYSSHLMYNLRELEQSTGVDEDDIDELCRGMAMDRVKRELELAKAEAAEEILLMERFQNPTAGMYQEQPKHLLASSYKVVCTADSTPSRQDKSTDHEAPCSQEESSRFRRESIESERSLRSRSDSIVSDTADSSSRSRSRKKETITATMFLNDDESAFYQTQDGALCFLSGFNMNCLRTEFSPTVPNESDLLSNLSLTQSHKIMPLPDTVEGKILEVERVHLTPDLRSRLRFLSHVPVYSDVCFVEISLGNILGSETKRIFKKEFQKRKQARQNRLNAEKRQDARARKQEQDRIDKLKARMQRIDPEDEFFHAAPDEPAAMTGDEFGPCLSTSPTSPHALVSDPTSMSFSQITREGGMFPTLESSFPTLGSSPPPPKPSWGPPSKSLSKQQPVESPAPSPGKKKGKGKKVVLLSTSSHRGGFG